MHKAEAKELVRANPANVPTAAATTADFIKTLGFISVNYQAETQFSRSRKHYFVALTDGHGSDHGLDHSEIDPVF